MVARTDAAAVRVGVAGATVVAVEFGMGRFAFGLTLPDLRAVPVFSSGGLSDPVLGLIASATFAGYLAGIVGAPLLARRLGLRAPLRSAVSAAPSVGWWCSSRRTQGCSLWGQCLWAAPRVGCGRPSTILSRQSLLLRPGQACLRGSAPEPVLDWLLWRSSLLPCQGGGRSGPRSASHQPGPRC